MWHTGTMSKEIENIETLQIWTELLPQNPAPTKIERERERESMEKCGNHYLLVRSNYFARKCDKCNENLKKHAFKDNFKCYHDCGFDICGECRYNDENLYKYHVLSPAQILEPELLLSKFSRKSVSKTSTASKSSDVGAAAAVFEEEDEDDVKT